MSSLRKYLSFAETGQFFRSGRTWCPCKFVDTQDSRQRRALVNSRQRATKVTADQNCMGIQFSELEVIIIAFKAEMQVFMNVMATVGGCTPHCGFQNKSNAVSSRCLCMPLKVVPQYRYALQRVRQPKGGKAREDLTRKKSQGSFDPAVRGKEICRMLCTWLCLF